MIKHKTFVSARVVALILGTTLIGGGKAAADQVITCCKCRSGTCPKDSIPRNIEPPIGSLQHIRINWKRFQNTLTCACFMRSHCFAVGRVYFSYRVLLETTPLNLLQCYPVQFQSGKASEEERCRE